MTSSTIVAHRKMPLRQDLAVIAILTNEVNGKSSLALSRPGASVHKTVFALSQKIRKAMASELKGMTVGGEGKIVEVDGLNAGGYVVGLAMHSPMSADRSGYRQRGQGVDLWVWSAWNRIIRSGDRR